HLLYFQVDSMDQTQFYEWWEDKFNALDFGSFGEKKIDKKFCWAIIQSQFGAPLQKGNLEDNSELLDKKGVPGIVANELLKEFGKLVSLINQINLCETASYTIC